MTADTKPESKKPDRPGPLLAWWVAKQVESLGEGYMKNDAGAVGRAARLRSVAARGALVNADAWEALGGFPTALRGHDDELSRAERAAFAALATFAVHQQAQRTQLVHVPKQGLGSALRRLGADHPSDAPIVRRFRALVAAQSYDAAVRHLTGLVPLLRSEGIGMDYGRLALDLYHLQDPARAHSVRLRWARDFYVNEPTDRTNSQTAEPQGDHA